MPKWLRVRIFLFGGATSDRQTCRKRAKFIHSERPRSNFWPRKNMSIHKMPIPVPSIDIMNCSNSLDADPEAGAFRLGNSPALVDEFSRIFPSMAAYASVERRNIAYDCNNIIFAILLYLSHDGHVFRAEFDRDLYNDMYTFSGTVSFSTFQGMTPRAIYATLYQNALLKMQSYDCRRDTPYSPRKAVMKIYDALTVNVSAKIYGAIRKRMTAAGSLSRFVGQSLGRQSIMSDALAAAGSASNPRTKTTGRPSPPPSLGIDEEESDISRNEGEAERAVERNLIYERIDATVGRNAMMTMTALLKGKATPPAFMPVFREDSNPNPNPNSGHGVIFDLSGTTDLHSPVFTELVIGQFDLQIGDTIIYVNDPSFVAETEIESVSNWLSTIRNENDETPERARVHPPERTFGSAIACTVQSVTKVENANPPQVTDENFVNWLSDANSYDSKNWARRFSGTTNSTLNVRYLLIELVPMHEITDWSELQKNTLTSKDSSQCPSPIDI